MSGSEDFESSASSVDFRPNFTQRVSFWNAEGKLLSVYRCVLGVTKETEVGPKQLLSCICSLKKPPPTVVILAGGGYFAAAVFKGKKAVTHKTFHRHSMRAKGGGAQSGHDARNKGRRTKSARACLRRHSQAALKKDINHLLRKWKEHITEARGIFLRVPRADRSLFFGRNTPIGKEDPRVFNIPFATRRATFEEVQRVHATLFSLQVHDAPKQTETDLALEELPISTMALGKCKVQPKRRKRQEDYQDAPEQTEADLALEELPISAMALGKCKVQPKRRKRQEDFPGPAAQKYPEDIPEKYDLKSQMCFKASLGRAQN
ncbi:hypothetical protein AB205_0128740 [Aquarana catesbeiana]|uniref:VLRF1 domain-containing protein n=1 Tax=Aquarana catesbeiana TaxID=8400 RepID=A0A2G9RYN9_AQUCT|nr:hypothetical protein AB205_0128740 [Aquarana catesbeiana]